MKIVCWGLKTPHGFMRTYDTPDSGFKIKTFRTRKAANEYLKTLPRLIAEPVNIVITVSVKDF